MPKCCEACPWEDDDAPLGSICGLCKGAIHEVCGVTTNELDDDICQNCFDKSKYTEVSFKEDGNIPATTPKNASRSPTPALVPPSTIRKPTLSELITDGRLEQLIEGKKPDGCPIAQVLDIERQGKFDWITISEKKTGIRAFMK